LTLLSGWGILYQEKEVCWLEKLAAVVLAAGKGTRMKSETPKVLFPVAGKPMLQHIVDTLTQLGVSELYVVIGHGSELVRSTIRGSLTWVEQRERLGTGHALAQAAPYLQKFPGNVLVMAGDTPLLTNQTLAGLVGEHTDSNNAATILTAKVPEPTGYGRIVRGDNGSVIAVAEEKDALPQHREINEINSGAYCFHWAKIGPLLDMLGSSNAQGEYYLTDIFSLLVLHGEKTGAWIAKDFSEVSGVNDRVQLAMAERMMRTRINQKFMADGVTMLDPDTTRIDAGVEIAPDTTVFPNTHILGDTRIGPNCDIGPDTTISSSILGSGVRIRNSVIEQANIGDETVVGPYAYLRPGTAIGSRVRVGDFVEIKNSQIGDGTKVPHLSYVGDTQIGSGTNIGCGVITANYDGKNKNKTIIGNRVFVGSNVNLVAPVTIEDDAVVAAGSTINENVPAGALAIARSRQTVKEDWRKKD